MNCSARLDKLRTVYDRIEQLLKFLDAYLPLANAHITDFILKGHWEKMVPLNIRAELLSLSDVQLCTFPSGGLLPQVSSVLPDEPCCSLDSSLPGKSVTETNDEADVDPFMNSLLGVKEVPESTMITGLEQHSFSGFHSNLEEFVKAARTNTLPFLDVLSDVKSLGVVTDLVNDQHDMNSKRCNQFMSVKKSYEILIMSKLCSTLAIQHNINKVVDVGCGLGYLGCDLVLNHGLMVLGVDSSKGRTDAADSRAKCLMKQWLGLSRSMGKEMAITGIDGNTKPRNSKEREETMKSRCDAFQIVTRFVTNASDLDDLIVQHFPSIKSDDKLLYTGLHTCGDLAADVIQLFLSSKSSQILCNVGCCYNLMTERFADNLSLAEGENLLPLERGFPMSKVLMERQFYLGSNARMLAAQSTDRIAQKNKIPALSLFWRSLLQVILSEMVGEISENWCIGKLASKCNNFYEYVQAALKRLDITKSISESDVEVYEARYCDYCRKIQCFYQLRTCLSPCIESLILLDRLAFLLEQYNIEDAHLVQLFDPVISPRCYAIVGIKKTL